MQNVVSLDTENLARRDFQHEGPLPPHTHTLEKHGGGGWGPRGPDAYELLKTPSYRLVRSQYCGIVWVKEEGSWRDLEICASPKVGGGRRRLPPPPWKVGGGERPPCPPLPVPTPMSIILKVLNIQWRFCHIATTRGVPLSSPLPLPLEQWSQKWAADIRNRSKLSTTSFSPKEV